MTELLLVRHGQTPANLDEEKDRICGQSNHLELTDLGRLQAEAYGRYLAETGIKIDAVLSSIAVRAVTTAEGILEAAGIDLPVVQDARLLEMSQGEAEGKPRSEIYTTSKLLSMQTLGSRFALPGAESTRMVRERMTEAALECEDTYPDQTVLVVTHGLAKRILVGRILGWDLNQIRTFKTPNCSEAHLTVESGKMLVQHVGKNVIGPLSTD